MQIENIYETALSTVFKDTHIYSESIETLIGRLQTNFKVVVTLGEGGRRMDLGVQRGLHLYL